VSVQSALNLEETTATYKPLMDWFVRVAASEAGHAAIERASGPVASIMDAALQGGLVRLVRQYSPGWNTPCNELRTTDDHKHSTQHRRYALPT
jgi:hypothetical protein